MMTKMRGDVLYISLEDLVEMNRKLDRIIEALKRLERSLIAQIRDWRDENRRQMLAF